MNVLFFGTPLFARIILEAICKDPYFNVLGLVTQEDKPVGRKQEITYSPTKEYALSANIPIHQPHKLDCIENILYNLNIDFIIVVAYGKLLPNFIIDNYFCINVHASILPYSRGASPMQDMILRGNKFVGISLIKMSCKLDAGDILAIRYLKNKSYDIEHLNYILANNGARILLRILKNIKNISPIKQTHCDANYCKKIKRNDGKIEFINAIDIYNKFLAYKNWPNVFLDNGLKLLELKINELDSTNDQGIILDIKNDHIIVGCLKGSLIIYLLQANSRSKMSSVEYVRGKRLKIGDLLN